jgi:hypothetical protein
MNLKSALNRRNRNPEGAAPILIWKQDQIPSVSLGYFFRYGKPQSAATGFGIAGIIHPDKRFEYVACKMIRYAESSPN